MQLGVQSLCTGCKQADQALPRWLELPVLSMLVPEGIGSFAIVLPTSTRLGPTTWHVHCTASSSHCSDLDLRNLCHMSRSYSNIVDGNYKFQVTAVAASGDVGTAQEADFTVDTTGPTVANVTFAALCAALSVPDPNSTSGPSDTAEGAGSSSVCFVLASCAEYAAQVTLLCSCAATPGVSCREQLAPTTTKAVPGS